MPIARRATNKRPFIWKQQVSYNRQQRKGVFQKDISLVCPISKSKFQQNLEGPWYILCSAKWHVLRGCLSRKGLEWWVQSPLPHGIQESWFPIPIRESGWWLGWIPNESQRWRSQPKSPSPSFCLVAPTSWWCTSLHRGLIFIQGQTISSIQAFPAPEDTQFHPSKM